MCVDIGSQLHQPTHQSFDSCHRHPDLLLVGYLDWYRDRILHKLAGLSYAGLNTPVKPLDWSPLGLIQHLTMVERR